MAQGIRACYLKLDLTLWSREGGVVLLALLLLSSVSHGLKGFEEWLRRGLFLGALYLLKLGTQLASVFGRWSLQSLVEKSGRLACFYLFTEATLNFFRPLYKSR